ncbi:MAG: TRAP transporter substrate-binding protein [Elusimicrobiota bacterium]|jgi:tripartite ATP-independent transporter DctP family solute receptor|nr:TRAP transporter substrate-binding protein [Elusimicrobiota bacterium]
MKKVLLGSLVLLFAFALVACGGKKSKTQVWKLAFNQSIEHPQAQGLLWLSDEFYKATDGAYRIEVNPNELLGNQQESLESLQNGVIQMAIVGNPIVEAVNPDFAVLALPGLYGNAEHQEEIYKSGVLNELFATTVKNNFYTLAAIHSGVRNIFAKKPVRSPADLKGMKIRVQQSQLMIDVINAMGAVAVPMSQGEVYTAIQQGVLDGAENNEVTYYQLKHYEVAPVFSYTRHLMIPDIIVINKDVYDSLSPEHKAIFDRLMKETIDRVFANFLEQVTQSKEAAAAKGATFIDDFDSSVFNKNFAGVITKTLNTPSKKKLYNAIKAIR